MQCYPMPALSSYSMPYHTTSCHTIPNHGTPYYAILCYTIQCSASLCNTKPFDVMQGFAWLLHVSIYLASERCFCVIRLVPLSRNILHHSFPSKTRWLPVLSQLRKKKFVFNKRSHCARQYQKNYEIWQYVFRDMYFFTF